MPALFAELLAAATCPRMVYVDHLDTAGDRLLASIRSIGEGIVAKRAAGRYHAGLSRDAATGSRRNALFRANR